MKEQVVLDIFGIPTRVEITISTHATKTFHYCFGIISTMAPKDYPLFKLKNNIEKCFRKELIEKLNSAPLIDDRYAWVFGEYIRVVRLPGMDPDPRKVRVVQWDGKPTLRQLMLKKIEERVRYYEDLMQLPRHEIKVKIMSAVLGNNRHKRKILTFNEKLVHFSVDLIDSVVIHELCHDFYQDHSKAFYEKVYEYCPDYKKKREKLIYGIRK